MPRPAGTSAYSPVGTADSFPVIILIVLDWVIDVFSISVVPMGLTLNTATNPGTKVPGYFHRVPDGSKMAGYENSCVEADRAKDRIEDSKDCISA